MSPTGLYSFAVASSPLARHVPIGTCSQASTTPGKRPGTRREQSVRGNLSSVQPPAVVQVQQAAGRKTSPRRNARTPCGSGPGPDATSSTTIAMGAGPESNGASWLAQASACLRQGDAAKAKLILDMTLESGPKADNLFELSRACLKLGPQGAQEAVDAARWVS